MARATFEGPVLSGDTRFGPLRNVGYTELVQDTYIDLSVTTQGTNGYAGTSGQYAFGNGIPNTAGQLYDYNDYMGENVYEAIGKCIVGNPCAIIQKVALILKFEDMFAEMGNKNA